MRILFLNSVFPGRFRYIAQAFGASPDNTVLFLAEPGQKVAIPGVRRLRVAPPAPYGSADPAEKEIVTRLRRRARAGNALLSLRKKGFIPDIKKLQKNCYLHFSGQYSRFCFQIAV
mgnify:CR=1 FL=1